MNKALTTEILGIIEANLPALAASNLKDILTKAEENTALVEELRAKYEGSQKYNSELNQENQKLRDKVNSFEKNVEETNAMRESLQKQLSTIEVDKMKIQLDAANARVTVVENLVAKVFGHPNVVINKSSSQSQPNGGYSSSSETISTTNSKM